jgi:hypothetical protein
VGAQTQLFPRPGAVSFKRLLGANLVHLARAGLNDGSQNRGDERAEVDKTVGLGAHHDHRHPDRREVLLMRQVLIHRYEYVEFRMRTSEELSVRQTSPTMSADRPDIVARKLIGKIVGQGLVKQDAHRSPARPAPVRVLRWPAHA